MSEKSLLNRVDLSGMALRSFLIQGCWNFDRMQNMGFAFSLLPGLKKIYSEKREVMEGLKRHLEFFNSQPYMSVFAIGSVARMEEDKKGGEDIPESDIHRFKSGLVSPLGAIGDTFFWASLRPAASLLAILLALTGHIWAPIIFILFYTVPHLYFRFKGVEDGYNLGTKVISKIKGYDFYKQADFLRDIGIIITGYVIAVGINPEGTLSMLQYKSFLWIPLFCFVLIVIFSFLLSSEKLFFKIILIFIVISLILIFLIPGYRGLLK